MEEKEKQGRCVAGQVLPGDYQVIKPLGKGGYGEVCAIDDPEGYRPNRAVKIMRYDYVSLMELSFLSMLNHPHIIQPLDVKYQDTEDGKMMYMYMPLYTGEPIWDDFDLVINRLLSALAYLQSFGICNGDLKNDNIVWRNVNDPVIIDFGLAVLVPDNKPRMLPVSGVNMYNEKKYDVLQTSFYRAPEVWNYQAFTCNIDVWSLGCILFKLISGKYLIPALTIDEFNDMLPLVERKVNKYIPLQYRSLILTMLTVDPQSRPNARELLGYDIPRQLRNFIPQPDCTDVEFINYYRGAIIDSGVAVDDEDIARWIAFSSPMLYKFNTLLIEHKQENLKMYYAPYIAYLLTSSYYVINRIMYRNTTKQIYNSHMIEDKIFTYVLKN